MKQTFHVQSSILKTSINHLKRLERSIELEGYLFGMSKEIGEGVKKIQQDRIKDHIKDLSRVIKKLSYVVGENEFNNKRKRKK